MAEAAEVAAESGGGGDSGVGACERGVAPIKAQYRTTKERFHEYLDADKQEDACQETPTEGPAEPEAKRIRLEDGQENGKTEVAVESHERQVPKRARGQNKSRPHMKPAHYDKERLCPSLLQESATPCAFGDRCRFLHDVGRYLETKPADLGPHCVLFNTFGRCPYSMTCRFAGAHLGPEGQNLVQEEVVARCAQLPSVRNGLDRALQQQLRKRQVCFERAEQALSHLTQGPMPTIAPDSTVSTLTPKHSSCHVQLDNLGGDGAGQGSPVPTCGPLTDEDVVRLRPCEKKRLDISGKLYLAPLTTCGNLPFRRICKRFGADVTCGEMAMCTNLLQGQMSEWALLKRHPCEDIFGVQLEGAFPDTMTKCAELLNRTIDVDFVDVNVGCPIDLVYKKGGGCALMNRSAKFQQIVRGMNEVLDVPLTVKMRTGVQERVSLAHRLLPELRDWGVALVTVGVRQWAHILGLLWFSWSLVLSPFFFFFFLLSPSCPSPLEPLSLLPSPFPSLLPLPHSSMAAPGNSATPGWPTGPISNSVPRWPAPCPCLEMETSFRLRTPTVPCRQGLLGSWLPVAPCSSPGCSLRSKNRDTGTSHPLSAWTS